jgi:hypothetical protein
MRWGSLIAGSANPTDLARAQRGEEKKKRRVGSAVENLELSVPADLRALVDNDSEEGS